MAQSTMEQPGSEVPHDWEARCLAFHERLMAHERAWPFLEPVDPVALNLPTYFDIIKNPMDMSTMLMKLQQHEYETPDEYRDDMVLMFENAMEFNRDDTHEESVGVMARKLLDTGLREWEHVFDEEEPVVDWQEQAVAQLEANLMQRAKDARMRFHWKQNSFVARLNRDKIQQRQRQAEAAAASAGTAA